MNFLIKPIKFFMLNNCSSYCFIDCWRVGSCDRKRGLI